MSSTRRVADGERRSQHGWASAPEFDVLRPINGTAVAFKAALQSDSKKRELLYALQALSQREGGTRRIAREILEMFPERIGSPTMVSIRCRPGKHLTRTQALEINNELFPPDIDWEFLQGLSLQEKGGLRTDLVQELRQGDDIDWRKWEKEHTAEKLYSECLSRANSLGSFIEDVCVNPKLELCSTGESDTNYRRAVETVLDEAQEQLKRDRMPESERREIFRLVQDGHHRQTTLNYFNDILGTLFEYARRMEQGALADYVETSIGKIIFDALDYAMETGKPILIEGRSGFGKSTAVKAWTQTRTTFFAKLARAFGVAQGSGYSSGKIQTRVEEFLRRSKLMLVIDEGQYLWPQGKRIESHPELINWLNTACHNEEIPFAISATEQFTLRRQHVERQTDWSSEQSRRRFRKVFRLPERPTEQDLKAVARHRLERIDMASTSAIESLVGYALSTGGLYFQAINDAVDDARLIARRAGRERVSVKDLQAAILEWRAPSDAALQRVFDSKPNSSRRRVSKTPEEPFNEPLAEYSAPLNGRCNRPAVQPADDMVLAVDG